MEYVCCFPLGNGATLLNGKKKLPRWFSPVFLVVTLLDQKAQGLHSLLDGPSNTQLCGTDLYCTALFSEFAEMGAICSLWRREDMEVDDSSDDEAEGPVAVAVPMATGVPVVAGVPAATGVPVVAGVPAATEMPVVAGAAVTAQATAALAVPAVQPVPQPQQSFMRGQARFEEGMAFGEESLFFPLGDEVCGSQSFEGDLISFSPCPSPPRSQPPPTSEWGKPRNQRVEGWGKPSERQEVEGVLGWGTLSSTQVPSKGPTNGWGNPIPTPNVTRT